jgi:hypothetical protein
MSDKAADARVSLRGKLPMPLPRFACPICGAKVYLTSVDEWGADDGEIIGASFDCETEPDIPDIDSDARGKWFEGHYRMPYVDWLPWEIKVMRWLNQHYHYRTEADL